MTEITKKDELIIKDTERWEHYCDEAIAEVKHKIAVLYSEIDLSFKRLDELELLKCKTLSGVSKELETSILDKITEKKEIG